MFSLKMSSHTSSTLRLSSRSKRSNCLLSYYFEGLYVFLAGGWVVVGEFCLGGGGEFGDSECSDSSGLSESL